MNKNQKKKYRAVPQSQIVRFLRLGTMSASIAGNMLASASSDILLGKKPTLQELLVTSKNMRKFVSQLSYLRGAALKLGQLLSLEGGDFIPAPISKILDEVRNDAYRMPPSQLKKVLVDSWGEDFLQKFNSFDVNPIAAASVGQVHKCTTVNNKLLAIKVQYPGVRESIDSDVNNMGFLLKNSGLIPRSFPLDDFLEETKHQLQQEVDYVTESKHLSKFSKLLKHNPNFDVPELDIEFTTRTTLAMEFKSGITIEGLVNFTQETKNKVIERLIKLIFMEIFEFNLVQTDPNFANFLYDESTNKIVLLDFGATRTLESTTVNNFKMLLTAILSQDTESIQRNLNELGLITSNLSNDILKSILNIIEKYSLPIVMGQPYDFTNPTLVSDMEQLSKQFFASRCKISIPPISTLLIQRKIAGIFLLAQRFKAKVDLQEVIEKYT